MAVIIGGGRGRCNGREGSIRLHQTSLSSHSRWQSSSTSPKGDPMLLRQQKNRDVPANISTVLVTAATLSGGEHEKHAATFAHATREGHLNPSPLSRTFRQRSPLSRSPFSTLREIWEAIPCSTPDILIAQGRALSGVSMSIHPASATTTTTACPPCVGYQNGPCSCRTYRLAQRMRQHAPNPLTNAGRRENWRRCGVLSLPYRTHALMTRSQAQLWGFVKANRGSCEEPTSE